MKIIYLDNAATTPISPEVLDAMLPFLSSDYGNAGAINRLGRKAASAIAIARKQVADFIGAIPEQIIFTSSGSEANNLAIIGAVKASGKKKGHIITSCAEHASVLNSCRELERNGFRVTMLPVNRLGSVDPDTLEQEINPDTILVSLMSVNNEVGAINQIKDFSRICSDKNVLFHTDCVQAAGYYPINVREISCDFLSISSHKIHGPKGMGSLFVRDRNLLIPIIHGGADQEFGIRGGTENVAGIVGFGKATELIDYKDKINDCCLQFCSQLIDELCRTKNDDIAYTNGTLGRIINLRFKDIDSETLVLMADARGVCISAGSACRSHESKPNHVLMAMGLSQEEAASSIRISFSKYNTPSEARKAAIIIAQCVAELRNGVGN